MGCSGNGKILYGAALESYFLMERRLFSEGKIDKTKIASFYKFEEEV
ncbi:hypothetical protein [Bacteroides faecalis]|uniref:Uncharacterized protein n=1 Tax=Bacteroides faecalis TaxID=2447885 RepID=A0A401LQ81_9BACE|nr:hypothetical protein [Bacteroides faecalis]GCB33708.1 hypothetical protein KGMB02408_06530 [Bacteroides faecalis]